MISLLLNIITIVTIFTFFTTCEKEEHYNIPKNEYPYFSPLDAIAFHSNKNNIDTFLIGYMTVNTIDIDKKVFKEYLEVTYNRFTDYCYSSICGYSYSFIRSQKDAGIVCRRSHFGFDIDNNKSEILNINTKKLEELFIIELIH